MPKLWTAGLSQRLRRRCGPSKTTVAWTGRILVFATLLFLVRQYAIRPPPEVNIRKSTTAGPRSNSRCRFPRLEDIEAPEVRQQLGPSLPLTCDGVEAWICIKGSKAGLCDTTLDRIESSLVNCRYDFLDDRGEVSGSVRATGSDVIELKTDVFNFRCWVVVNDRDKMVPEETLNKWEGRMAGVVPKAAALAINRSSTKGQFEGSKVNVLLWDLGPISRLAFIRKLPKTYAFIVEELRGFVFKGYNSMGVEGQEALMTILTSSATVLDDQKTGQENGQRFLWSNFSRRGYVTALAMEGPLMEGTPMEMGVDHHLGQLYGSFAEERTGSRPFCSGSKPRHEVLLEWTVDFFDAYPNNLKLAMVIQRELSEHGTPEMTDEANIRFLRTLQVKGHLEHTVVIVLSDSGHRAGINGASQRAKTEELLPFLSMVVPSSFDTDLPETSVSLQMNTNRLVTQTDIHQTLIGLLDHVDGQLGKRSQGAISLLVEVPAHRTCEEASIPAASCTCLKGVALTTRGCFVQKAAEQLVDFINDYTEEHRSSCERLRLVSLTSCRKFVPNQELLAEIGGGWWKEGFLSRFLNLRMAEEELYHLTVVTDPGRWELAAYAYSISSSEDRLRFDVRWIYRDTRSDVRDCVPEAAEEVATLCYCQQKDLFQK